MQSSIEFVVILSGIVSLVAASAALYMHQASYQKLALESMSNMTVSQGDTANYTVQPRMYVYASIGNVTHVGSTNPLEVVVSLPEGSRISSVVALSGNADIEPEGFYNLSSSGISGFSFKVIPMDYGVVNVSVTASATYGNYSMENATTAYSFAVTQRGGNETSNTSPGSGALSTAISYRNQSILYGLSNGTDIIGTRTSNHCLYQNFWYKPYPVSVQCGTGDAWDFWIFDNVCYTQGDLYRVYCVYPTNSSYKYYGIASRANYSYNVSLRLYNSSASMEGSLVSGMGAANLTRDGHAYGNAIVASVMGDGPEPYTGYAVLSNGSRFGAVNTGAYDAYSQALGTMRSVLGYYNGTGVSQDQADQIWQALGSYGKAETAFTSSAYSSVSGCRLLPNGSFARYSCTPYSNLDYVINAEVNGTTAANYSSDYYGSVVNIREG